MRNILKSSFVWQFAGGFLLGAVGLFTLQPEGVIPAPMLDTTAVTAAQR